MTTQMEKAHSGLLTEEIKRVAATEGVDAGDVRKYLALGHIVIP